MSMSMGMMKMVMMQEHVALQDFDTTLAKVREQALDAGWFIPFEFELQEHYIDHGLEDMTRCVNVYLCYPEGGYAISKDDRFKAMFVMMPTAMSVYENSRGEVRIARMRFGTMATMFSGDVSKTLKEGERRLQATIEGLVEA